MTITYPPEMLPSPDEGEEAEVRIDCPKCWGVGHFLNGTTCWKCGGAGTIVVEQLTNGDR